MTPNEKRPAVEMKNVEFSYTPGTPVLKGISTTFNQGEFITIIGQNGSGKSTLVKHINGLLKPDSGSVTVYNDQGEGFETDSNSMSTLASVVGYTFQNPDNQIFHSTVYDEISYGLDNIGVADQKQDDIIADVLERIGLPNIAHQNPFRLSKGQRQRLAIASVLAMEPEIICVDEPTTGQDRSEAVQIMEILKRYNEEGHTIIAITHDIALAAEYTDRMVVVGDGKIIDDGKPEQVLLNEDNLKTTNIRPPQITQLGMNLKDQVSSLDRMWLVTEDAYEDLAPIVDQKEVSKKN